MAIEEAKYTVMQKDGHFEVRDYEPYVLAETRIAGDMESASSQAFRLLFNYITGSNRSQTKVAMTTPVSQEPVSEKLKMTAPVSQEESAGEWVVSFMMPAEYRLETLPQPSDPRVYLREVPGRQVAVIRYSGFWSQANYLQHLEQLEAWMDLKELTSAGPAIWARFNAPFTPWFLRRNEVQIPLERVASP